MEIQSHLTTEQIDLLQEVKWWIRRDAHGFDMDYYLGMPECNPGLREPERNTCGTTMCIAGYMVAIHDGKEPTYADQIIYRAYDIIRCYGGSLFFASNWPANIKRAYDLAKTDLEKADAACRAIDAFIAGEF